MPTKRRPLSHLHIGEMRVTEKLLDTHRAWQDALRTGDLSFSSEATKLGAWLADRLGHVPWGNMDEQDADFDRLHVLAYPDPKTRPERLGYDGRRARRRPR